jgi:transcriptional regulator with XRE-family HTH domain
VQLSDLVNSPKKLTQAGVSFASRLQGEMERWHINQASLAARLGVSPGTVSGWFTKGALPHPRIRSEIAQIFGITPEWLFYGAEPKLNELSRKAGEQIISSLPAKASSTKTETYVEHFGAEAKKVKEVLEAGAPGAARTSSEEELIQRIPVFWEEFMAERRPYMKAARIDIFYSYVRELRDRFQTQRR